MSLSPLVFRRHIRGGEGVNAFVVILGRHICAHLHQIIPPFAAIKRLVLQTGESGQQVGAVRAVVVGSGVVVEKLVAVDAEEHYL